MVENNLTPGIDNGVTGKKKTWPQAFSFFSSLKVQIVLSIFLVCIIIFALNFLNIISLEKAFPIFSFLPHFGVINSVNYNKANSLPNSNGLSPSITIFQYDRALAGDSLSSYAKSILKSSFLLASYKNQDFLQATDSLAYLWDTKDNTSVFVKVFFVPSHNTITKYYSRLLPKDIVKNALSQATSEDIFHTYFSQNDKLTWNCTKTQDQVEVCNAKTNLSSERNEYSIEQSADGKVFIFTCSVKNDSPIFAKNESCLH